MTEERAHDIEFERFYEDQREAVRAYCFRRADASLADDVVSQTFEIAWRRRSEVRRPTRGWLLGIAGESFDDSPPILDALSRLSDPDRETLMLAAWDGLASSEAGRVLGCSPVAFHSRWASAGARRARFTLEICDGQARFR